MKNKNIDSKLLEGSRDLYRMSLQPSTSSFIETIQKVNDLVQDSNFRCTSFIHHSTGAMKKLRVESIEHQDEYVKHAPNAGVDERMCRHNQNESKDANKTRKDQKNAD